MIKQTKVSVSRLAEKQLAKVPDYIRNKAHEWIKVVEAYGLEAIRKIPGLHDEPLKGDRRGQRSVRLNRSYRLIYSTEKNQLIVEIFVIEVTNHEY